MMKFQLSPEMGGDRKLATDLFRQMDDKFQWVYEEQCIDDDSNNDGGGDSDSGHHSNSSQGHKTKGYWKSRLIDQYLEMKKRKQGDGGDGEYKGNNDNRQSSPYSVREDLRCCESLMRMTDGQRRNLVDKILSHSIEQRDVDHQISLLYHIMQHCAPNDSSSGSTSSNSINKNSNNNIISSINDNDSNCSGSILNTRDQDLSLRAPSTAITSSSSSPPLPSQHCQRYKDYFKDKIYDERLVSDMAQLQSSYKTLDNVLHQFVANNVANSHQKAQNAQHDAIVLGREQENNHHTSSNGNSSNMDDDNGSSGDGVNCGKIVSRHNRNSEVNKEKTTTTTTRTRTFVFDTKQQRVIEITDNEAQCDTKEGGGNQLQQQQQPPPPIANNSDTTLGDTKYQAIGENKIESSLQYENCNFFATSGNGEGAIVNNIGGDETNDGISGNGDRYKNDNRINDMSPCGILKKDKKKRSFVAFDENLNTVHYFSNNNSNNKPTIDTRETTFDIDTENNVNGTGHHSYYHNDTDDNILPKQSIITHQYNKDIESDNAQFSIMDLEPCDLWFKGGQLDRIGILDEMALQTLQALPVALNVFSQWYKDSPEHIRFDHTKQLPYIIKSVTLGNKVNNDNENNRNSDSDDDGDCDDEKKDILSVAKRKTFVRFYPKIQKNITNVHAASTMSPLCSLTESDCLEQVLKQSPFGGECSNNNNSNDQQIYDVKC
jgi:hypothetical protein